MKTGYIYILETERNNEVYSSNVFLNYDEYNLFADVIKDLITDENIKHYNDGPFIIPDIMRKICGENWAEVEKEILYNSANEDEIFNKFKPLLQDYYKDKYTLTDSVIRELIRFIRLSWDDIRKIVYSVQIPIVIYE